MCFSPVSGLRRERSGERVQLHASTQVAAPTLTNFTTSNQVTEKRVALCQLQLLQENCHEKSRPFDAGGVVCKEGRLYLR